LEYPFQNPTLSNKQRNKIELERLKLQLNEKKDNDLFKLETEYELTDTYEILNLELENTTLTTEILTLKSTV
jgi:ribosomal protein S4